MIGKLFNASFAPWWVMFVFGAWLSAAPMLVERVLRMNGWILVVSYCVAYYIAHAFDLGVGNSINFFCYVLLSLLILKLAYTNKGFAEKILHGNDFSYGVYIYHMPVINIAIWLGFQGSYVALFLCLVLTVLLGVSSWFLIERPFLRLKKAALRKYS